MATRSALPASRVRQGFGLAQRSLLVQARLALGRRGMAWLIAAFVMGALCCGVSVIDIAFSLGSSKAGDLRDRGAGIRALEGSHRDLTRALIGMWSGSGDATEGDNPALQAWTRFSVLLEGVCRDADLLKTLGEPLDGICRTRADFLQRIGPHIEAFAPPAQPLDKSALREIMAMRDQLNELNIQVSAQDDSLARRLARDAENTVLVLSLSTAGFLAAGVILLILVGRASLLQLDQSGKASKAAALLRETIDALPAGVVVYDRDERLTMFNSTAATLMPSLREPGTIGRTYAELARRGAERLEAAGKGPQPTDEWIERFRTRTTQRTRQADNGRWYDWAEKETSGGLTVGLRIDVTEIKNKEIELDQERLKYQTLVDSLSDMVCTIDLKGAFTYVSPAASGLLGVPPDQVIGSRLRDWLVPEDVERVAREGMACFESSDQEMRRIEFRVKAADGVVRLVEARYRKIESDGDATVQVGVLRDITERVELQGRLEDKLAELAAARAEYRSLVDSLSDIVYKIDSATGRLTFVSAAAADFFGEPLEKLIGAHCLDYVAPEFHAGITEQAARPFHPLEPAILSRFCMLTSSGMRHVEARARRSIDEQGRLISTGVMRDIEERVQLERRVKEQVLELERAHAQYQSLVDSLSDVVYTLDVQSGTYTFISAAGAEFFGKEPKEILGRHFLEFIAPESQEYVRRMTMRDYQPDDPGILSRFCVKAAGGEIRHVEVRAQRRFENGRLVSTGVIRDIEERVQLERRLESRGAQIRSVVESSGALIAVVDPALKIVMVNSGFTTLSGVAEADAVGAPLLRVMDCPLDVVGSEPVQFAVKLRDAGGRQRLVSVTATPVHDDRGRIDGVVLLGVDDTERREAEQALYDTERFATVGEMAGTMAHEISQPLQVINIACASAREELTEAREQGGAPDNLYVEGKLERIAQQVEQASRIIDDLRDFVRGTANKEPAPFDPTEAVRSAIDLTAHGIRQAGASLIESLAARLPSVSGDVGRLEQVLVNLINNARDAGGRSILISAEAFHEGDRPFVRISVEDTGAGIPEDLLPRLFVSFVTTKPRGKGTGLGLRICRRIVEEMGGSISASNRPEGGARFDLLLPAVLPPDASQGTLAL